MGSITVCDGHLPHHGYSVSSPVPPDRKVRVERGRFGQRSCCSLPLRRLSTWGIMLSLFLERYVHVSYSGLFSRGVYFINFEIAAIHINFRGINRKPHLHT